MNNTKNPHYKKLTLSSLRVKRSNLKRQSDIVNITHAKLVCLYILITFLSSCSWIYPEYNKPKIQVNQSWSTNHNKATADIANSLWWHNFNDPTLNNLVESALKNNNSINISLANIKAAQGQLQAVNLSFIPSLSTYFGYSTNPMLGNPHGFYGVWPGYFSLNVFANLAKQKAAEINLQAKQYALQSIKLTTISSIVNSYLALLAQGEQQQLLQNAIADTKQILEIEKHSMENSLMSEFNYDDTLAKLKKLEAAEDIIQTNIIKSQNALAYLLNQPPHKFNFTNQFKNINIKGLNPNTLPANVLDIRPDVHAAEEKYKLAIQNTAMPYTSIMPNITLDEFIGSFNDFTSTHPNGEAGFINDSYMYSTLNPSILGQIKEYNANEKSALFVYLDTINKALQNVDNSMAAFSYAKSSFTKINERYFATDKKYNLKHNLYAVGNISKLDLLNEQVTLSLVEVELNQAKLMHVYTLVQLYTELAAGVNSHLLQIK